LNCSSEEDDDDVDDDDDDVDEEDDRDEEEHDDDNDDNNDEEPLNSEDDVNDDDPSVLFETDNVVVCQYDKVRLKATSHLLQRLLSVIFPLRLRGVVIDGSSISKTGS